MFRFWLSTSAVLLGSCSGVEIGLAPTKNMDPAAIINSPLHESTFVSNEMIDFMGTISDPNGLPDIQGLSWVSSLDGELSSIDLYAFDDGGVTRFSEILSSGTHVITLSVTDVDGASAQYAVSVSVGVENPEPIPQILDPVDGDIFVQGDSISLIGHITDPQFAPEEIEAYWYATDELTSEVYEIFDELADELGETVGTWDDAPIGSFIISLEAINPGDYVFTDEVSITVEDPLDQDTDGDGYTPNEGDCDDTDPYTYPGANELADGVDNDCDGTADEGTELYDDDGDGYCESTVDPCTDGTLNGDCDDTDPAINPGVNEICNDNIDNDCDTQQNEEDADDCIDYFYDLDTDTWGSIDTFDSRCYCNPTNEWTATRDGDCDDNDDTINPGAVEIADGIDNNCDGIADEGTDLYDNDGDGYCADDTNCTDPTILPGDCDDTDDDVNPAELEICGDGVDNDCTGTENDLNALGCKDYYLDGDGDTFGHYTDYGCYCEPSGDYEVLVPLNTDCNDSDAAINPNALELADGIDNNCDGLEDEGTDLYDNDGDGYCADATACTDPTILPGDCDDADATLNPGANELCGDGVDNDCDGDLNNEGAVGCTDYYLDDDRDTYGHLTESRCYCETNGSYDIQLPLNTDCDDSDPTINPGATELADGIDQNCDGTADEGTDLYDNDGDGYCADDTTCTDATILPGDCDDTDDEVNPNADEICGDGVDNDCSGTENDQNAIDCNDFYLDGDGDNFGHETEFRCYCEASGDYEILSPLNTDCNDSNAAINPDALEIEDGIDNNCDGFTDEGTSVADNDGDGYCENASGCADAGVLPGDCDDTDADVNPAEDEVCGDGIDNNCDSDQNTENAIDCDTYYLDGDGDYFGHETENRCYCDPNGDYDVQSPLNTDCNDSNAAINPDALEIPDGIDNNCDGNDDEGTALYDNDGDGYCADATGCTDPTVLPGDCNDSASTVNPGEVETCGDGIDNNCDNDQNSEGAFGCITYYLDGDGDNYGHLTENACYCSAKGDYDILYPLNTDCDDDEPTINPNGTELPDGIDQDCDGTKDEGTVYYDDDGDGYCEDASHCTYGTHTPGDCNDSNSAINPGANEQCGDGIDNNCVNGEDDLNATGCTDYYYDGDGDGFGDGGITQCTCSGQGNYDVTNSGDCYDGNADASPNQTGFFITARGDGSFDYDCDQSETKYYNATYGGCVATFGDCIPSSNGWASTNPSCGNNATYVNHADHCSWDMNPWYDPTQWGCERDGGASYKQQCR